MSLIHYWQVLRTPQNSYYRLLTTVITTLLLSLIWPASMRHGYDRA